MVPPNLLLTNPCCLVLLKNTSPFSQNEGAVLQTTAIIKMFLMWLELEHGSIDQKTEF